MYFLIILSSVLVSLQSNGATVSERINRDIEKLQTKYKPTSTQLQKEIEELTTTFGPTTKTAPAVKKEVAKPSLTTEEWYVEEITPLLKKFMLPPGELITYKPKLEEQLTRLFTAEDNNVIIDPKTPTLEKSILEQQVKKGIENFIEKLSQKIDIASPNYKNYLKNTDFDDYQENLMAIKEQFARNGLMFKKLENAHAFLLKTAKKEKSKNTAKEFETTAKKVRDFAQKYFEHLIPDTLAIKESSKK